MVHIDVIATSISGSISDWAKVEKIVPLFAQHGFADVTLHEVETHIEARRVAQDALAAGGRHPISAGGSGTFRAVLEGCIDSEVDLTEVRLGFLRKGSADLIGKVLGMPDEIEPAIRVFVDSIQNDRTIPADILSAWSKPTPDNVNHFIGYGGSGIFGRIPYYTENRFVKYYKGGLGQIFGDLGPFTVGMILALLENAVHSLFRKTNKTTLVVDGREVATERLRTVIIVNGYLGKELPFSDKPIGSKEFYIYTIQDQGLLRLFSQAKHARAGTITTDPDSWGFQSYTATDMLEIHFEGGDTFPVNIDGSTLMAEGAMCTQRTGSISLLAA